MKLYFMGICGTAMGNTALMLRQMGYTVCGADSGIYPPMSDVLRASDIELFEGYDPKRLENIAPDLVVVGNVVSRGHPEMEWLLETRAFRYISLPALLSEQLLSKRKNIVVTGTHGKTTTSTLAAYLLKNQPECEPGYLIGGVPYDLPSGAAAGVEGGAFVIEGDEYDSAFFDKRSKFIHYLPNVLALGNLEFDHADIFRDLDDIKRSFRHVLRLVPRNGHVVLNGEDKHLKTLLPASWTTVHTVGKTEPFDLQIRNFEEDANGSRFELLWHGQFWARVQWSMAGYFNVQNAAIAALCAGLLLYPKDPRQLDLSALKDFKGVKRRQEVLLETDSLRVLEDFGHHPSALRETLASMRRRYPEHRIHACFEPRSNTARSRVFQHDLVEAFADADAVYLGPVHRADKMQAHERLDTTAICAALKNKQSRIQAEAFDDNQALLETLIAATQKHAHQRQLTLFFSNGSFDGIMPKYVQAVG